MLYRFADADALAALGVLAQRQWWRDAAERPGVVESRRGAADRHRGLVRRARPTRDIRDRAPRAAPPRWKQAIVIWLAFFPLSLLISWLYRPVAARPVPASRVC